MRTISLLPVLLSLAYLPFNLAQSNSCYFRNGTKLPDELPWSQYQPCEFGRENARNVMCCYLDPAPGTAKPLMTDVCLPNGLCREITSGDGGKTSTPAYWREYCGVENGIQDGRCLDICPGHRDEQSDGTLPITACGSDWTTEKWCCGRDNSACCDNDDDPDLVRIPRFMDGSLASVGNTSSSDGSATSTFGSSSSQSQGGSRLSVGAQAGIGVGVSLGVMSVLAIGCLSGAYYQVRKHARSSKNVESAIGYGGTGMFQNGDQKRVNEMSSMLEARGPVEMDASSGK